MTIKIFLSDDDDDVLHNDFLLKFGKLNSEQ